MSSIELVSTSSSEKSIGRCEREPVPFGFSKISTHHHERLAVVYVRQSTPRQVVEHRESRELQYRLSERAEQYGWQRDRIVIIDDDQGLSGRTADGRLGFQRLLAEVSLNHVGLVLGIEMSRLARSCKDWHQLLELCALFRCLLADQDGLYDPSDYNDRLLLGLKGTMSEAELHILKGRMQQGSWNKARRGELIIHVPIGYVRLPTGEAALDPDEQAQSVVHLVFEKFEELGSAMSLLRYLRKHDIRLPVHPISGPNKGQREWRTAGYSTIVNMLHNPTYAGAYSHGRYQIDPCRRVNGKANSGRFLADLDDWKILLHEKLPAYISWEQFIANLKRLHENRSQWDTRGVPRQGPALLAGILFCGKCGRRLSPHYKGRTTHAAYECKGSYPATGVSKCQRLSARFIDGLLSNLVLQAVQPASLQLSLEAGERIREERERIHTHWKQQLERAGYESDRAKRQFDAVEPENRLVARELERRWEEALIEQRRVEEDYDRFRRVIPRELSMADIQQIEALAAEIPSLWTAAATASTDRQTIVRHLIERVVVEVQGASEIVDVTVHWAGGFVSQHEMLRSIARYDKLFEFDRFRARVTALWRSGCSTTMIAETLNAEGFRLPTHGKQYTRHIVRKLLDSWGLTTPRRAQISAELAALGENEWWIIDLSRELGIAFSTLARWSRRGWMHARKLSGRCRWWIVWADDQERDRLRRLYAYGRGKPQNGCRYPIELRTPGRRSGESQLS